MSVIKLDNQEFEVAQLSQVAREQYNAILFTEGKLKSLNSNRENLQKARRSVAELVSQNLPEKAHPNKKNGIVTINGDKFVVDDFAEETKKHLNHIIELDKKLALLDMEMSMVQTARNSYVKTLSRHLQTAA
ncbi:DUF6447 family protein [Thiomicrorhabdus indica]|uniref:DUF6447 family protein n=1 Tax=Thiomicrorhabdus indica TaxID=2267253 RepID=UPI00102E0E3C|nr:DUF6447 family protein [Thiomicrorhabdus indica]